MELEGDLPGGLNQGPSWAGLHWSGWCPGMWSGLVPDTHLWSRREVGGRMGAGGLVSKSQEVAGVRVGPGYSPLGFLRGPVCAFYFSVVCTLIDSHFA